MLPAAIRHAIASSLLVVAVPLAHAQAPDRPVVDKLPAAASIHTAAQASSILRKLFFLNDYYGVASLGDSLYPRFGRDPRVLAWYAGGLARALRWMRADSLTRRIDTASTDPWALIARSLVLTQDLGPRRRQTETLSAHLARRALTMQPHNQDFAWRVADAMAYITNTGKTAIAFADSVAPHVGNPAELRVAQARQMYFDSRVHPDTARREAAWRTFAAARASDTSNFNAIFQASNAFDDDVPHRDDVWRLMQRAVARSPRSTNVRSEYWFQLGQRNDIPRDERKALVAADRQAWLRQMDSATWALWTVASSIQRDTNARADFIRLSNTILERAPQSPQADAVRYAMVNLIADSLRVASDTTIKGTKGDSLALRQRYVGALESYIDRPVHPSPSSLGGAALSLFMAVREDSAYPTSKLVKIIHTMVDNNLIENFSINRGWAARTLAERKVEFRFAESLAREGEKIAVDVIAGYPDGIFSSVGEKADALDGMKAGMRDALAWVYFNEGRYADAERELNTALDLSKKDPTVYYHLGKLRQAQGRADAAALAFTQGMTLRYRGVNPNRKELETAYLQHHGSMDGWTGYVASLEAKERATRKAKILAADPPKATLGKGFRLVSLTGDSVAANQLKGHYSVVNFWGTWCGPCVAEMPELQQFYDKYKADSSVKIITISNDKDLQDLKDWMAKRKYTIPTLFDNGYVTDVGITAWPTTWFVDPDGTVRYSAIGNGGALVEEWSWRLEAMRPAPVAP